MAQGGGSAQVDARGGLIVKSTLASLANQKSVVLKEAGTISLNMASIAAGASGSIAGALPGAKVGDLVFVNPPDAILAMAGLAYAGAAITDDDELTITLANAAAVARDLAVTEFQFLLFSATA